MSTVIRLGLGATPSSTLLHDGLDLDRNNVLGTAREKFKPIARRSLDASLKRLGLDHVDILFIHDVNRKYHGERVHERLEEALAGACKALADLRRQGIVRAFGPATMDVDIASAFVQRADIDCLMLPARYTMLDQSAAEKLFPVCLARGVSVLAAAPFDSGILATGAVAGATYDYQPAPAAVLSRVRSIEALCARFNIPIAAAALQFPLQHPAVTSVVTGMRSAAEVRQNLELMRIPIPAAFWSLLRQDLTSIGATEPPVARA